MEKQEIVQLVKEQLPALLEESPELERWIERLTAQRYANRQQTESRFDQLMEELRRDREEQSRKWAEQNKAASGKSRKLRASANGPNKPSKTGAFG